MDGLSVHDFPDSFEENDYESVSNNVKERYDRRLKRLNDVLFDEESILFVRMANNTKTCKNWINRFHSEPDDFSKRIEFIKYLNIFFKKTIYLIIITTNQKEYEEHKLITKDYKNIIIEFFDDTIQNSEDQHYLLSCIINNNYIKING